MDYQELENQVTIENGLAVIKLSDGRTARFTRKHKAKDSSFAHDQAGKNRNEVKLGAALLSTIVTIDDRPTRIEEMLELDHDDFNLLLENIPGNFSR